MDTLKLSILLGAIVLPVFVSFGWNYVKKTFHFAKTHHLISVGEHPDYVMSDLMSNEEEEEILKDCREQYKPGYNDDLYC